MVDGVTLRGGVIVASGGGVLMTAGTIRNCAIANNSAGGDGQIGGGICMNGGLLQNSTVISNTVTSSWDTYGGGIGLTSGTVENCMIAYNTESCGNRGGGGVYLRGGTLRNSLVFGNSAPKYAYSSYSNIAAGVWITGGTMYNCTIVRNRSAGNCGGVYVAGGGITNCIVWNNVADSGVANDLNYSTLITYSCSSGLSNGVNNCTTNDPAFVASGSGSGLTAVLGNCALVAGSPCINKGTNDLSWMTGTLDLAGKARIQAGTVDMGAYEWVPPGGTVILFR